MNWKKFFEDLEENCDILYTDGVIFTKQKLKEAFVLRVKELEVLMKDCLNSDGSFKQNTQTKIYNTAYYRFMGKWEDAKDMLEALGGEVNEPVRNA